MSARSHAPVRTSLTVAACSLCVGCWASQSAPVQSIFDAPPAARGPNDATISSAAGLWMNGGLTTSVPVGRGVHVEMHGDLGSWWWLMGSAGIRTIHPSRSGHFLLETSAHLGAGVGGWECAPLTLPNSVTCETVAPVTWNRGAVGAGTSLGLAYRPVRFFDVFVRASTQLSLAYQVPTTFWYFGQVGVSAHVGAFTMYLAGGIGGNVTSRATHWELPIFEIGMLVRIPLRPRRSVASSAP